jgi:hypothetical protein
MLPNPAVDEVQEVRSRLIARYGGIDGYVKHLREFEKTLPAEKLVPRAKARGKKPTTAQSSRSSSKVKRGASTRRTTSGNRKAC